MMNCNDNFHICGLDSRLRAWEKKYLICAIVLNYVLMFKLT